MDKVIGIIDGCNIHYDETALNKGIGGSETWVIQIAQEFARRKNLHIIVFCNCDYWHFDEFGVEWIPINILESRLKYQQFDYIIISRVYEGFVNLIKTYNDKTKIVLQSHDWGLGKLYDGNYIQYSDPKSSELRECDAIIALSEYHIQSMRSWVGIPESVPIEIIPNGIDPNLFKNLNPEDEKDFGILWSSRPERGCDILCDKILPVLREHDPDIYVNIASYDPIQDRFKNRESEGIYCLGSLSKTDLYKEMSKHRVWFYPAIYPETFNITSLESVLCGNELVLPFLHGMATTFKIFKDSFMKNKFYNPYHVKDGNDSKAYPEAIDRILYLMDNHFYYSTARVELRNAMKNYILENYTWKNTVDKYLNLFNNL